MQPDSAPPMRNGHRRELRLRSYSAMDQPGPGERADLRATLDDIQAQADLVARAIAKLVDVAQAGFACACAPPARRPVCLNDLVVEVLRALGERARVGAGVSVALDPTLPSVAGDPRQLRSVLHTLLVALMQEREGSGGLNPITVQTSRAAGVLQGEHIARVALAGAAARTLPPGTLTMERGPNPALAVPLSLASRVLDEHGGALSATSTASTFRFTLELPSIGDTYTP